MPPEELPHEGTWLQWPHNHGYDKHHIQRYESIWVQMTSELNRGENVHIIAYDKIEKERINNILASYADDIDMNKVSFVIGKTDDVWVRDNGPIFVRDIRTRRWDKNYVYKIGPLMDGAIRQSTNIAMIYQYWLVTN